MIMKIKLNKTIRAISFSIGLILFSANTYALQSYSVDTDTIDSQQMVSGDSVFVDIETALSIAMSESPTIKVADMEIEKKKYTKKSTQAALFPQIDLVGQYTRTIKKQTMYLDGGFGGAMGGDIDPTQFTPEELKIVDVINRVLSGPAPDPADEPEGAEGIQFGRSNMWTAGAVVNLPIIVPSL